MIWNSVEQCEQCNRGIAVSDIQIVNLFRYTKLILNDKLYLFCLYKCNKKRHLIIYNTGIIR